VSACGDPAAPPLLADVTEASSAPAARQAYASLKALVKQDSDVKVVLELGDGG
jgi:hypothetical protein